MNVTQITARVNPDLKKNFTKAAKRYGLPVSGLLSMFMRMVVDGKIVPEMAIADIDSMRTPELQKKHNKAMAEYERGEAVDLETVMKAR